jgi:hypothetical protein
MSRKKNYARAVGLIRRIVRAENKPAWQEGESMEEALDAAKEFLGDLRTQRAMDKAQEEIRREWEGQ